MKSQSDCSENTPEEDNAVLPFDSVIQNILRAESHSGFISQSLALQKVLNIKDSFKVFTSFHQSSKRVFLMSCMIFINT